MSASSALNIQREISLNESEGNDPQRVMYRRREMLDCVSHFHCFMCRKIKCYLQGEGLSSLYRDTCCRFKWHIFTLGCVLFGFKTSIASPSWLQ